MFGSLMNSNKRTISLIIAKQTCFLFVQRISFGGKESTFVNGSVVVQLVAVELATFDFVFAI